MKRIKYELVNITNSIGIFALIIILSTSFLNASTQEEIHFDSIYFHTAVTVAANDVDKALAIADSLYLNSDLVRNKVRSLMLSSSLFQQKGNLANSIILAKKAYLLAEKNKIYEWQARISGFLSTQYRIMEMYQEGTRYLEEGIKISKKIDNEQASYLYQGLILQEQTYYFLDHKELDKALNTAKEAELNFEKLENKRDRIYFTASNQELLGRVCIHDENWELAESYYLKSLQGLTNISQEDLMVKGQIYSGLGKAYFQQEKLDLAIEFLEKAESLLEHSRNVSLEIEVFKTLSEYYYFLKDYDTYVLYNEKYIVSFKDSEKKKKESINQFIETTKIQEASIKKNRNVFVGLSILFSIVILVIIVFYRNRQKKEKQLFQTVMQEIIEAKKNLSEKTADIAQESSNSVEEEQDELAKTIMPEETEQIILERLHRFEKSKKFLDKNISLSKLASIIETNNKYLSHVLNTHKGDNFNAYINELRIKYIINKLNDDRQYRNYKISYLAEESGFSSHTKFSQTFKSVTGLSPSVFLKELDKMSA